jgi:hypothetical protein
LREGMQVSNEEKDEIIKTAINAVKAAFGQMIKDEKNNIIAIAAEAGAKAALEKVEQERKHQQRELSDRRLRNTKLLLRNYHMLREHMDSSVFGRSQMEESAADILDSMMNLYNDEIIIESIRRSATRTAIIITHIETMVALYEAYCIKSNNDIDSRRYEVLYDSYIADEILTVKQIAKKQNISKETVYGDLNVAIERLSALIFGVDGLKLH